VLIGRLVTLLALAAGLVLAPAASAAGGLAIAPAILEQTAAGGASGTVTVANNSSRSLKVAVTPRPWRQSRGGAVAADRRHTLDRFVRVSDDAFTLAPGDRRALSVTLARVPARRSLYGTLEVIGRPKKRKGVNVAYRLIGSLRFNPAKAARRLRLGAGAARVHGRTLSLAVSNRGNTIDPVGGRVVVSGPRGGRSGGIVAVKILPGKRVNVDLMSLRGLRPGRYTAAVTLRQRGKNRVSVSRHFHIRGS
jgi:P pilus assembly chaperone PapD